MALDFFGRKHRRRDGMLYVQTRAVSSRVNLNFDAWPSNELKKAYKTFIGKPVFVDHHSEDKSRARGVVLDSEFRKTKDDSWIELLLEIDAITFPNLAEEISSGGIDSVSIGAIVDESECSICGEINGCIHIPAMKGQTVSGELVYELCHGIQFYEISLVFDPADATAMLSKVYSASTMPAKLDRYDTALAEPFSGIQDGKIEEADVFDGSDPVTVYEPFDLSIQNEDDLEGTELL